MTATVQCDDTGEDCPVHGIQEPPTPTRLERAQRMLDSAKYAQDTLGWAEPADHERVTFATVDLARVVTQLAEEFRELVRASGEHRCPACGYTDTCPPENTGTLTGGGAR